MNAINESILKDLRRSSPPAPDFPEEEEIVEIKVRASEIVLVLLAFLVWGLSIFIFFRRWGKIRIILPPTAFYVPEAPLSMMLNKPGHANDAIHLRQQLTPCRMFRDRSGSLAQESALFRSNWRTIPAFVVPPRRAISAMDLRGRSESFDRCETESEVQPKLKRTRQTSCFDSFGYPQLPMITVSPGDPLDTIAECRSDLSLDQLSRLGQEAGDGVYYPEATLEQLRSHRSRSPTNATAPTPDMDLEAAIAPGLPQASGTSSKSRLLRSASFEVLSSSEDDDVFRSVAPSPHASPRREPADDREEHALTPEGMTSLKFLRSNTGDNDR
ncbi:unnamed protein product [Cyprideis torosa]|uniref:Uncharacterized protein n=1 Tax=Cyprideis torosa TaxID=163714 RepID=A0A7R8ZI07_9CRUS|nr:unnamed protein product [Cyprideis torosa]CAG0879013.1 unnamed protein product [Cyprideis torosa]